ncbi:hypothetical protein NDU88_001174 [Pleurodeles waltl]|uniref:Uncharacterized protein n=1 Tax=Pleurodeles waltl TaxID=8319 RepID=A0AAV7NA67_PLEWA|nr:hypothetical protein NDU88_001174 [Pleurodeles waltl]
MVPQHYIFQDQERPLPQRDAHKINGAGRRFQTTPHEAVPTTVVKDKEGPVTRSFLEALFTSLKEDLQVVKKDLSADLKEVRSNVEELDDRVSAVEDSETGREEEVKWLHQEVLHLQDQPIELQSHAKDLENHSRRNNACIQGVSMKAKGQNLCRYMKALFQHILGAADYMELKLDRVH